MDGLGVLIYPYGGKSVVGEWKDGKEWNTKHRNKDGKLIWNFEMEKNGLVTITYPDGDKYVGEFKDGGKNGQGTYIYHDGRKYEGEWKNGREWNVTGYNKNGEIGVRFINGKQI